MDSEKNSDVWRQRPVSLMVAGKDREYLFSGLLQSTCLGLNDLDVVEALIDDLESAISLYN